MNDDNHETRDEYEDRKEQYEAASEIEVIIPCEDGMVLHVRGGYGREEVCLGIGRPTEDDRKAGFAGMPALVVLLDREVRTALRKALRSMMRGGL